MAIDAPTTPIPDTRSALRYRIVEAIRAGGEERAQELEGGPLDGVHVVTAGNLEQILGTVLTEPLPPVDEHTGEVLAGRDPAVLTVWAECPRCGIAQTLLVTISPQLVIDVDGSELKLKAKSKGHFHACGQLTLEGATDTDQESFGLEDIIGDQPATIPEMVAELCNAPFGTKLALRCRLPAFHAGDHVDVDDDSSSTD